MYRLSGVGCMTCTLHRLSGADGVDGVGCMTCTVYLVYDMFVTMLAGAAVCSIGSVPAEGASGSDQ